MVRFRSAPLVIILTGQSLNGSMTNPMGAALEDLLGFRPPIYDAWVSGYAWAQLKSTAFMDYMTPYTGAGVVSVVTQIGGTTDYSEGAAGATVYANEGVVSAGALSRGADFVLGTTTTPSTIITGGNETKRTDGNTLVVADASNYFDTIVDLAGTSGLDDPNSANYSDGTHWTFAGRTLAAETIAPFIVGLL